MHRRWALARWSKGSPGGSKKGPFTAPKTKKRIKTTPACLRYLLPMSVHDSNSPDTPNQPRVPEDKERISVKLLIWFKEMMERKARKIM